MAYQFYIDADENTVFVEHTGIMDSEETFEVFREMLADPQYRSNMNVLRDTRFAELPQNWSYSHFRGVTAPKFQDIWTQMGTCKLAWVAGHGRNYRLAHQAAMTNRLSLTGLVERKPFVSMDEAVNWLGLRSDYIIRHEEEPIRSYA